MRKHWNNCIAHFDHDVGSFIDEYFASNQRRCFLVAGAGFDPRARVVTQRLAQSMGDRLSACFIREERGDAAQNLVAAADSNTVALAELAPASQIVPVEIFAQDGAPVAGARVADVLRSFNIPAETTDIVLDKSALSIGVGFPIARFLLEKCDALGNVNFHVIVVSNPELDAQIFGEPDDRVINVRGFSGASVNGRAEKLARIWVPQLAHRKASALAKIRAASGDTVYKVCPTLPFPARNPRRADELIAEFEDQLRAWEVDVRDIIYVSERNPLDSYRTLSTLKQRYDRTVDGVFVPQLVLSPIGSKVMATGAMMAAIEHDLPVQYVETLRYEFDPPSARTDSPDDMMVHLWLQGPIYAGLRAAAPRRTS